MKELSFEDIEVGQSAVRKRTITESDILKYAEVTGNYNPIHVDEEFAKTTIFRKRMAPAFLVSSMISAILGTQLPGPGAIYLKQSLDFTTPVRIGDEITARVEVTSKDSKQKTVKLKTICFNQRGSTVIEGEATVLVS
jgi:3-hydroxybutyryl-CoA dehydratase